MAELKQISLALLDDHPDNPRLVYRDDVVDGIAANLTEEWPQQHALHVRPVGARYQIIAGHTRKRAAEKRGMHTVWAWVEELADEAAHMLLATSNNQGELSPLEIGLHALKAVPASKGGRGKKGGLKEYAAKLGKTQQYITQLRQAAEVFECCKPTTRVVGFIEKSKHLCAIHKLPRACWSAACQWLASHDASVVEVEQKVTQTLAFEQSWEPGDWQDYLPTQLCAAAVFCGTDPRTFRRLKTLAEEVAAELHEHQDLSQQWRDWLRKNRIADSWDINQVQLQRFAVENIVWERTHNPQEAALVSVLLAAPPWECDVTETDKRPVENQSSAASVEEIARHITAPWAPQLADDCVLYLWAPPPRLCEALQVMEAWGFEYKTSAVWDKERVGAGEWLLERHELLLVGTRGKFSPPAAEHRVSSVIRDPRMQQHSHKSMAVYEMIERAFPAAVKCELYQRESRPGWLAGGQEA